MPGSFGQRCWLGPMFLAGFSLAAIVPPAAVGTRFTKRSLALTGLNVSAPGTQYDQEPLSFDWNMAVVTPVGKGNTTYSYQQYSDFNYAIDNNGNLVSHGVNLCWGNGQNFGDNSNTNDTWQHICGLVPNNSNVYVYDNCKKVLPCANSNSWGVYDGKWLTWGGSYDKWCIIPNNFQWPGFLTWVHDLGPPGSGGNQYCQTRVRVQINSTPAPTGPPSSTTTTTTTTTPVPPPSTTTTKPTTTTTPTTTKPTTTTTTTTKPSTTTTTPTTTTTTTKPTTITSTTTKPTTTTTTTTTKPTTITTTTTTPKPTTITSTTMTNTTVLLPNSKVTSAVNTASSYIQSASSAYSKFMSNTSNAILATSAQNALETAVLYIADAKAVAVAESVPDIASELDDVGDQLIEAAARAAIVAALLTAVAVTALTHAYDILDDLFNLAFSSAKDPAKDPAPPKPSSPPPTGPTTKPTSQPTSTPTTTTTTTSSTPFVCTLCIACDDAALPMNTAGVDGSSDVIERSIAAEVDSSSDVIERSIAASVAGANRGSFCQQAYNVPSYYSFSRAGDGNIYSPFYNYWESHDCNSVYNFNLISGPSQASIPPQAPPGYQVPNTVNYVTEHIYEIQSIETFLNWTVANGPPIIKNQGSQYCNQGLGALLRITPAQPWSTYNGFDYTTAPIAQVFNLLPGAGGASEFVYLESKVNGVKAQLFNRNSHPGTYLTDDTAIPQATRILIAYLYLRDPTVTNIYRKVSSRIRDFWYRFGQACAASSNPTYNQYGTVDWQTLYDNWEYQLFQNMAADIKDYAVFNLDSAQADITTTHIANPKLSKEERYFWVNTNVDLKVKEIQNANIDLSSLPVNS